MKGNDDLDQPIIDVEDEVIKVMNLSLNSYSIFKYHLKATELSQGGPADEGGVIKVRYLSLMFENI